MSHHVILVVEDETLVRLYAVALIEDAGCAAMQAASAAEAITLLESHAEIDAIFTDIDLPGGMDGMGLAAVVRGRWPPIEVIVTSGHAQISEGQLPERGYFLPKPYTGAQLSRVLDRLHLC